MPSLLVTVFVLQLVIHIVNTIGAAAIGDLAWTLWNKLPTSTSQAVRDQVRLRRDVVRLNREMRATSSQDEFAKWAKLRRQHDKAQAEYDEKTSSLKSFKSSFDSSVSVIRWLCTNGIRFFLQFWYTKRPMFWVPQGWLPVYAEWLLGFPRAPWGAVSIQVWGGACAAVISLVSAALSAVIILVAKQRQQQKTKGDPMKSESAATSKKSVVGKKEL